MGGLVRIITKKEPPKQVVQEETVQEETVEEETVHEEQDKWDYEYGDLY